MTRRRSEPEGLSPRGSRPQPIQTIGATSAETATYIAQMANELAGIARGARQEMLAYFLMMARMEAETIARGHEPEH